MINAVKGERVWALWQFDRECPGRVTLCLVFIVDAHSDIANGIPISTGNELPRKRCCSRHGTKEYTRKYT